MPASNAQFHCFIPLSGGTQWEHVVSGALQISLHLAHTERTKCIFEPLILLFPQLTPKAFVMITFTSLSLPLVFVPLCFLTSVLNVCFL